jgi:aminodeoxyfutalosine deaminase
MNHPGSTDGERLAAVGASVAYCPRTHEFFGRGRHPFRDLMDAGVNVCLGTDSAASSGDLSLLDEMRAVRRNNRGLWPALILRMATLHGAAALGLEGRVGALAPGMAADLFAIPLSRGGPADPLLNALDGDADPDYVAIDGRTVYSKG